MGRPNVGKSSLFNVLTRTRRAMVQNRPGVTRDLISGTAEWWGHRFQVFDSGGLLLGRAPKSGLAALAQQQVLQSAHNFDFFILVADGRQGLCDDDVQLALWLRQHSRPFCVAVNKIDTSENMDVLLSEFFQLHPQPIATAFEHGIGVDKLVEHVIQYVAVGTAERAMPSEHRRPNQVSAGRRFMACGIAPRPVMLGGHGSLCRPDPPVRDDDSSSSDDPLRLAVVGQPNAGKSQLCNHWLGAPRMLVYEQPGTTLDCVEEDFVWQGHRFQLVDTAGLRARRRQHKKQAMLLAQDNSPSSFNMAAQRHLVAPQQAALETLAGLKSFESIEKADLVLLVVDAVKGVCDQSLKIAQFIQKKQKPFVLVMNKCDCLTRDQQQQRTRELKHRFHFSEVLHHFVSARTGRGTQKLLKTLLALQQQMQSQISTAQLNKFLQQHQNKMPAPRFQSQSLKCYYMTQTRQVPPCFLLFVNEPRAATPQYKKFLTRRMQRAWGLQHVPLRLHVLPR